MEFIAQPNNVQQVKVKILLSGGHKYTVYLNADAPMLYDLMRTIDLRSQKNLTAPSSLFQIPLKEGRAALCFPSEQLIGLVTEPPVYWQKTEESTTQTLSPSIPWQTSEEPNTQISNPLVSEFIQIDNFLTFAEKDHLIHYVLQKEADFVPTTTSTNDVNYRRSMILYSFPEFSQLITKRIKAILPDVFRKLKIESFPISEIETQLTSHNDGNYYKVHNDNGSVDTATREFTYVYYFYQEPKAFSGGDLVIYDSKVENNYYVEADTFHTVEPRNNSIVFFLSRYMHEVLPVSCPSQAFADSRFTINGWIRR